MVDLSHSFEMTVGWFEMTERSDEGSQYLSHAPKKTVNEQAT